MVRRDTAITYEEELKKHPELKESDVQMLREWCAKQPHLPKISDVLLLMFLRCNDCRIEPTKARIEMYCTLRTHIPEFFSNRDPIGSEELRIAFKNFAYFRLEKPTCDGYTIEYAKIMTNDSTYCNYNSFVKCINMIGDLLFHMDGSRRGIVFVFNVQNVTPGHIGTVSPMALKKHLYYLQEAWPSHVKGIHIMKTVPAMDLILRMAKPFMKKELFEMIKLHSTTKTLTQFIPLDALPNDDGGKAGNVADLAAEAVKKLEDNRAWFQTEEATMRVNELLRPGKSKTSTDLFGVEGSFKKLDID